MDAFLGMGFIALFFIIFGIMVLPLIFYLLTLQKALNKCQPANRTMSPGMVWLQIIPFFGIVWQFFVVAALANSLGNEFRARRIVEEENPGKSLGIAVCVLNICTIIPFVGTLAAIAYLVVWIVYWVKIAGFSGRLDFTPIPQGAQAYGYGAYAGPGAGYAPPPYGYGPAGQAPSGWAPQIPEQVQFTPTQSWTSRQGDVTLALDSTRRLARITSRDSTGAWNVKHYRPEELSAVEMVQDYAVVDRASAGPGGEERLSVTAPRDSVGSLAVRVRPKMGPYVTVWFHSDSEVAVASGQFRFIKQEADSCFGQMRDFVSAPGLPAAAAQPVFAGASETRFCSSCGRAVASAADPFCGLCGARLQS